MQPTISLPSFNLSFMSCIKHLFLCCGEFQARTAVGRLVMNCKPLSLDFNKDSVGFCLTHSLLLQILKQIAHMVSFHLQIFQSMSRKGRHPLAVALTHQKRESQYLNTLQDPASLFTFPDCPYAKSLQMGLALVWHLEAGFWEGFLHPYSHECFTVPMNSVVGALSGS